MPGSDLTAALLRRVSRSFYLSLAVLPAVGAAHHRPRLPVRARLRHHRGHAADRPALRASPTWKPCAPRSRTTGRVEPSGPPPARRRYPRSAALLERLPECLAAYRALPPADRARVHAVLATIIEGQIQDLRVFPGRGRGQAGRARDPRGPRPLHLPGGGLRGRVLDRRARGPSPAPRAAGTCRACARWARASARGSSSPTCCATCRATCARAAATCPARTWPGWGLEPRDLLDPARAPARAAAPGRVAQHRARSLRSRLAVHLRDPAARGADAPGLRVAAPDRARAPSTCSPPRPTGSIRRSR